MTRKSRQCGESQVVLVSMPWANLTMPSIQLGTVQAILSSGGVESVTVHGYVYFAAWLLERSRGGFTLKDYEVFSNQSVSGLGDAVFSSSARAGTLDWQAYAQALGSNGIPEFVMKARALSAEVGDFLDGLAERVLSHSPRVVGFSTTFSQNCPSAALATELKKRRPDLKVVFGGANCEGRMGPALMREFDCIDVCIKGQAEGTAVDVFSELAEHGATGPRDGVCVRCQSGAIVDGGDSADSPDMNSIPCPDYAEYFTAIREVGLEERLRAAVTIPFETARGCWWGAKHHCIFCGLNGGTMNYRSKAPQVALAQLETLARRHEVLDFTIVDNIMDMDYLTSFLPSVVESGAQYSMYYEVKANLTRDQVRLMSESGITAVQPGIESLSSGVLKIMDKGATALQNIALLKWCREYGIRVDWNLLCGFPGEAAAEYERMARLIPYLVHLPQPSGVIPIRVDRFSPLHSRPEDFGFELEPLPFYSHLYRNRDEHLRDLAYFFRVRGPRDLTYVKPLSDAVDSWRRAQSGGRVPELTYRRGPDLLIVKDTRGSNDGEEHILRDSAAALYLDMDAPRRLESLVRSGRTYGVGAKTVETFLNNLIDLGLAVEENGRFLGLATSERPRPAASGNRTVRLSVVV